MQSCEYELLNQDGRWKKIRNRPDREKQDVGNV